MAKPWHFSLLVSVQLMAETTNSCHFQPSEPAVQVYACPSQTLSEGSRNLRAWDDGVGVGVGVAEC